MQNLRLLADSEIVGICRLRCCFIPKPYTLPIGNEWLKLNSLKWPPFGQFLHNLCQNIIRNSFKYRRYLQSLRPYSCLACTFVTRIYKKINKKPMKLNFKIVRYISLLVLQTTHSHSNLTYYSRPFKSLYNVNKFNMLNRQSFYFDL